MALSSRRSGGLEFAARNIFPNINSPEDFGLAGLSSKTEPPRSFFSHGDLAQHVLGVTAQDDEGWEVSIRNGFLNVNIPESFEPPARSRTEPPRFWTASGEKEADPLSQAPLGQIVAENHAEEKGVTSVEQVLNLPKTQGDSLMTCQEVADSISHVGDSWDVSIARSRTAPPRFLTASGEEEADPLSQVPLGRTVAENHAEEKGVTSVEQVLNIPKSQGDSLMTCHELAEFISHIGEGWEVSIRNGFVNVNIPESFEPPARSRTEPPRFWTASGEKEADPLSQAPLGQIVAENHAEEKGVTSVEQVLNLPKTQGDSLMTCQEVADSISHVGDSWDVSIARSRTAPPRFLTASGEEEADPLSQVPLGRTVAENHAEEKGVTSVEQVLNIPKSQGDSLMTCHELAEFISHIGEGWEVSIRNGFVNVNIPESFEPPARSRTEPPRFLTASGEEEADPLSQVPLGHVVAENHAEEKGVTSVEQVLNIPKSQGDSLMTCHEVADNISHIGEGWDVSIRNGFVNVNIPESFEPPARSRTEPPRFLSEQKAQCGEAGPPVASEGAEPAFVDLSTLQCLITEATPTNPSQARLVDGLTMSFNSGISRVQATFAHKKICGSDTRLVSKEFDLAFGEDYPAVPFKIVLLPLNNNFREGKGYVQLVCLGDKEHPAPEAKIHFRILVGTGPSSSSSCVPWSHNFSKDFSVKLGRVWDFKSATCNPKPLVVTLEVLPPPKER